jgi:hypothetical protein
MDPASVLYSKFAHRQDMAVSNVKLPFWRAFQYLCARECQFIVEIAIESTMADSTNSVFGVDGFSDVGWPEQNCLNCTINCFKRIILAHSELNYQTLCRISICSGLCPVQSQPASVNYTYACKVNKTSQFDIIVFEVAR